MTATEIPQRVDGLPSDLLPYWSMITSQSFAVAPLSSQPSVPEIALPSPLLYNADVAFLTPSQVVILRSILSIIPPEMATKATLAMLGAAIRDTQPASEQPESKPATDTTNVDVVPAPVIPSPKKRKTNKAMAKTGVTIPLDLQKIDREPKKPDSVLSFLRGAGGEDGVGMAELNAFLNSRSSAMDPNLDSGGDVPLSFDHVNVERSGSAKLDYILNEVQHRCF